MAKEDEGMFAAYVKAAGAPKKLYDQAYADAKAVEDAGAVALECGEACETLDDLEKFKPALSGSIRYVTQAGQNQQQQAGPLHHLFNKMVEGFAGAGRIKNEEMAIECARLLRNDSSWVASAERELLKAAIPVLRTPSAIIDFAFNLESDRARSVLFGCLNLRTETVQKAKTT